MKIKIVKCFRPTYWYHERIGEIFDVLPLQEPYTEDYLVNISDLPDNRGYVRVDDAEIIKEDVRLIKQIQT
jgi:hypothetical protein